MKKIRRGLTAIAVAGVFLYTFNVQYFAYFLSLVCNSAIECVSGGNEYSAELTKELNTLSVSKFIRLTVNGKDIDLDNTDFGQDFYDDIVGAQETAEGIYEKSDLAVLKNIEIFNDSAIEHIFVGQINEGGNATGYHYDGIKDTAGRIIPGTESQVNQFGVYEAKVEVNGIKKITNNGYSTFFPADMSPQQVVDAINEAYNNKKYSQGNTYSGVTGGGIKINMYIDGNGKIISAYPIY